MLVAAKVGSTEYKMFNCVLQIAFFLLNECVLRKNSYVTLCKNVNKLKYQINMSLNISTHNAKLGYIWILLTFSLQS